MDTTKSRASSLHANPNTLEEHFYNQANPWFPLSEGQRVERDKALKVKTTTNKTKPKSS